MSASVQLISVLRFSTKPLALHEIQSRIKEFFGDVHETTALSARIRSGAKIKANALGYAIKSKRAENSAKYVYWLEKV